MTAAKCCLIFCAGVLGLVVGCTKSPPAANTSANTSPPVEAPEQRGDQELPIDEADPALMSLQQTVQRLGGTIRKYSVAPPAARDRPPGLPPKEGAAIEPAKAYVHVQMSGPTVSDVQLAEIVKQPGFGQVTSLSLHGSKISDDGMRVVAQAENLEMINLSDTQVTEQGLEFLKGHKSLRYVSTDGTQISFAALDGLLRSLPSLRTWWEQQGQ